MKLFCKLRAKFHLLAMFHLLFWKFGFVGYHLQRHSYWNILRTSAQLMNSSTPFAITQLMNHLIKPFWRMLNFIPATSQFLNLLTLFLPHALYVVLHSLHCISTNSALTHPLPLHPWNKCSVLHAHEVPDTIPFNRSLYVSVLLWEVDLLNGKDLGGVEGCPSGKHLSQLVSGDGMASLKWDNQKDCHIST